MRNKFIVAGKYGFLTATMLTAAEQVQYAVSNAIDEADDFDPYVSPSRDVRDAAQFPRREDAVACRFKITDGKVFLCVEG